MSSQNEIERALRAVQAKAHEIANELESEILDMRAAASPVGGQQPTQIDHKQLAKFHRWQHVCRDLVTAIDISFRNYV